MKLFLIFMVFFIGCVTKDDSSNVDIEISKIQSNCSLKVEQKQPIVEIQLTNRHTENVYLFLSYWEVNGLKDSADVILGYPTYKYLVNQIQFYPKSMKNKSIKYIGEKRESPLFNYLPKVLKLGKNETQNFKIRLSDSITQILDIEQFNFYFFICYTTEKIWKSLEEKIGENIHNTIILPSKMEKEISIPSLEKVYTYEMSNIAIQYTSRTFNLYNVFNHWVKGKCSLSLY